MPVAPRTRRRNLLLSVSIEAQRLRPRRRAKTDLSAPLDELDLVAGGILDERDHRRAVLHRGGLARDSVTERAHAIVSVRGWKPLYGSSMTVLSASSQCRR